MKCYGMLQNDRVIAFTVSEFLKEQQGWGRGVGGGGGGAVTQTKVDNADNFFTAK